MPSTRVSASRRARSHVRRYRGAEGAPSETLAEMSYPELVKEYRDAHWGQMYFAPEVRGPGTVIYLGRSQSQEYANAAGNERLKMRALAAEIRRRGHNVPRGFC
jgi:hypothetical protein